MSSDDPFAGFREWQENSEVETVFEQVELGSPDFERDLEWVYSTLGSPVREADAPSPSAWFLRDYALTARATFFKFYLDYVQKRKKDDDRDAKWQDDHKKQMAFLETLSDEMMVMSREGLTALAQDSPYVVIEVLTGLGWVINGTGGSSGAELPGGAADRPNGLVLPESDPEIAF